MQVTITKIPLGSDRYQLELTAPGTGPLIITYNEVSPDGITRTVKATQSSDGTEPVATDPFDKLESEINIVAEVYDDEGEKIGDGEDQWD